MKSIINDLLPKYIKIRQCIHQSPELGYEEHKTAKLVTEHLQQLGYKVKTGIGKTGVTTTLDTGKPGKTIALRADMDALPITEDSDLPYASNNPGVMHACGHDGHTTTLLAVAEILPMVQDQLSGKIKLIFQPAEEGGNGADAMINDGILDTPLVDAIFGYHNWPGMKVGQIGSYAGCMMAARNNLKLTINGKGGHAAMPEKAIDPIVIGSQIVQALQTVVSRKISPMEPVVLTVAEFHAGTSSNIIPDKAVLSLNLRATSTSSQQQALQAIESIATEMSASSGATITLEKPQNQQLPPTINHIKQHQFVLETAKTIFGSDNAIEFRQTPTMGSEDFAFYLQQIPGCFFFVGNGESASLHNPKYNYNDEVLPIAIEMMTQIAINY